MDMNEIKEKYPNCPNCGRHCPIDAVSCPRGRAFVEKLLSGELEASGKSERNPGHDRRGEEHEHRHRDMGQERRAFHGEAHEHPAREGRPDRSEHGFRRREYDEMPTHHGHGDDRACQRDGHGCHRHDIPDDGSLPSLFHQCMHRLRHGGPKNMGQSRILRILAEVGEMGQRELQEQLGIQPGSLSEILNKLESKGLIRRSRDEQDRRRATLQITEDGRTLLESAPADRGQSDPFAVLTEEEQETLRSLLNKVLEVNK